MDSLEGMAVSLRQTGRGIATRYAIASAGLKAASLAHQVQKAQTEKKRVDAGGSSAGAGAGAGSGATSTGGDTSPPSGSASGVKEGGPDDAEAAGSEDVDDATKAKIAEMSGHMMAVMWHVTELDLRATLAGICKKICRDRSVDEATRNRRKKGLLLLGEVYMQYGNPSDAGLKELRNKFAMGGGGGGPEGTNVGDENGGSGHMPPPPPPGSFPSSSSSSSSSSTAPPGYAHAREIHTPPGSNGMMGIPLPSFTFMVILTSSTSSPHTSTS